MKRSLLSLAIAVAIGNPMPNLYQCRSTVLRTHRISTAKKTSALGWTEHATRGH